MSLPETTGKSGWFIAGIWVVFLLLIALAGWRYYQYQEKEFAQAARDRLSAIADLKASQIAQWYQARQADAEVTLRNPVILRQAQQFLLNPKDEERGKDLLAWMQELRKQRHYSVLALLDQRGEVKLSVPPEEFLGDSHYAEHAQRALRSQNVLAVDLHRGASNEAIHFSFWIPVRMKVGADELAQGVFLFQVDPQEFLYALVQSWPTPSATAETLLVRREGDQVVFLNELRHRTNTALRFRVPLTQLQMPAIKAVLGYEGIVEGLDYRGVPVLAATRAVPGTPWFMIAKMDKSELFAPLRERAWLTVLMTLGLWIMVSLGVAFFWKKQKLDFARQQVAMHERDQAALRESEQRFRLLVQGVQDYAIYMLDPKGQIKTWNAGAERLKGYTAEEILSGHVSRFYTPEDCAAGKPEQALAQAAAQGRAEEEGWRVRKNGSRFWANVVTTALRDGAGNLRGFAKITRDLTERKRAEDALKLQFERMPIGYITWDPQFRVTAWNPAAEKIFGYSAAEALGKHPYGLIVPKEVQPQVDQIWQRLLEGDAAAHSVNDNQTKNGRKIVCGWNNTPLRSSEGQIMGVLSMVQDITERVCAEAEIRQLNQTLEERVRERTAQLEQANKELEAFSYSVSHDLRAPLRAVDGYAEMLMEDYAQQLDSEGQRVLKVISSESKRMGQLIDDLLSFSHLGRCEMRHAEVNLTKLAQSVWEEIQRSAPDRNVDFDLRSLPPARGDANLLRQAFSNLLSNAFKFTQPRHPARIEMGSLPGQGETIYYVKDNGVGFDMRYVEKLFCIFQRLHSLAEFPGTGVGLALTKRIIHRHGGRIWAEGKLDQGASFYFTLPN